MNTEVRKIVIVPRFTTYAAARTYLTPAVNVREFAYVELGAWRGPGVGTTPSFDMQVQTSMDLDTWSDLGDSFDPHGEVCLRFDLAAEWMRLSTTLGGTSPAFTCWANGAFATRTAQAGARS